VRLFLGGDVMLGRGVDQILPRPCPPHIHEREMTSAEDYVVLAERVNGPIPRRVDPAYPWGDLLAELDRFKPDARIVNLETAVTRSEEYVFKGINYRVSPENARAVTAAAIDTCVLANNHVVDWGEAGLRETIATLDGLGIQHAGAGMNAEEAEAPAIVPVRHGRVLVFAFGSPTAGVDWDWAAGPKQPGVNLLGGLSREALRRIARNVAAVKRPGDVVIASIHWGPNFSYHIAHEESDFAHWLIDDAGVEVVHGHSSHHPRGIEVYAGRAILYGCGDLINDYEGIEGHEEYRADLVVAYFLNIDQQTGRLRSLALSPFRLRRLRLQQATGAEAGWLARLGTRMELLDNGRLSVALAS